MDKEFTEILTDLKVNNKILRGLVDTILDNSIANYTDSALTIKDDAPVLAVIKAFFGDEYDNCLKERIRERDKRLAEVAATSEES